MKEWNVVVSLFQDGYRRAFRALSEFGPVDHTPYHNLLVMAVEDPLALLDLLELRTETDPALYDALSRVAPAMHCFAFRDIEEFKQRTTSVFAEWLPRLGGCSFHVRLHARGPNLDWRTPDAERYFDDWILAMLKDLGSPGSISFSKPDAIIAIDTIDDRAGMSFWSREQLERHHLLRPD
jgi:hypothetical protein